MNIVFNLLIDIACGMGNTSKLMKLLSTSNYQPKLISYNTIRLREKIYISKPAEPLELVVSKLGVLDYLLRLNELWSTACIETWIEVPRITHAQPVVLKHENLCIYIRMGARGRQIYKLAWLSPCRESTGSILPESTTRFCIQSTSTEALHHAKSAILKFTKVITSILKTPQNNR